MCSWERVLQYLGNWGQEVPQKSHCATDFMKESVGRGAQGGEHTQKSASERGWKIERETEQVLMAGFTGGVEHVHRK